MTDYIALAKNNLMKTYSTADICIDHGEGVRLYDTEGKSYLDMVAGIAVNALGYGNEKIKKRVEEVMSDGFFHVSNLYYNKWAPLAAERLNRLSGGSEVFYANSGAEANEAALKIARKYGSASGRTNVISFSLIASMGAHMVLLPLPGRISTIRALLRWFRISCMQSTTIFPPSVPLLMRRHVQS